jgi:hypothetical protein
MPIPIVERSDRELARKIRRKIQSLPEVAECKEVTVGFTRKKPDIHFHVILRGNPSFEDTHKICYGIDRAVRSLVPNTRVVIHSESSETHAGKDVWKIVKKTAEGQPGSRGVQNIHLRTIDGKLGVDLSLQVAASVGRQHGEELQKRIVQELKVAEPRIADVVVHQRSVSYLVFSEQSGHGNELGFYVEHVAKRFPEIVWLGPPVIRRMGEQLDIIDRVGFVPGTPDSRVTEITSEFGAAIRTGYPAISRAEIIEAPGPFGEI